ncbi:MAG: NADH-quinone oxidoreductase subunit NuoH [Candidatus Eisenbacteria bacterium]|nr:NADH-quinone oxidoreductase subunit NuoH [Candidatus Eisenbacteria bacterium]
MTPDILNVVLQSFLRGAIVIGTFLGAVTYLVWAERKIAGHIQLRIGPERVGPFGLLQTIADVLKLFLKEDVTPTESRKILFHIAPMIAVIPAMSSFAVIPFSSGPGGRIADLNVGVLYVFAFTSLSVYAIVLAGWSSNSKYSVLGGLRATAQMISYELSMGLAVMGVLMGSGSLSLVDIVNGQAHMWNIVWQPLGFLLFLACAVAETNRAPFDLPEAESELVAGFHTEYSSMKWAFFFLGEYAAMITACAMMTTLFLGGWQGPFLPPYVWFCLKVAALIFVFIWLRWTFPRLRYDQLMAFGWKVLLPLSLFNIVVTAVVMTWIGR